MKMTQFDFEVFKTDAISKKKRVIRFPIIVFQID